jgi:hypothetical protein
MTGRSALHSGAPARRVGLVAGAILVVGIGVATSQTDPLGSRLKVSLFHYAGAEEGAAKNDFSCFKGILKDKLVTMAGEVESGDRSDLARLSIEPDGTDGLPDSLSDEAAAARYWDQSRSLILLRGTLFPQGSGHIASSRIYFGNLGPIKRPLALRLPISDDQFANTFDSHSAAIYYALAADAERLGKSSATVTDLLELAKSKIVNLQQRGPLSPDLEQLRSVIASSLADQRKRTHP